MFLIDRAQMYLKHCNDGIRGGSADMSSHAGTNRE